MSKNGTISALVGSVIFFIAYAAADDPHPLGFVVLVCLAVFVGFFYLIGTAMD